MSEQHSGVVKFFSTEKGYGFIVQDAGGEIYVHRTGLSVNVSKGDGGRPILLAAQRVVYSIADSDRDKGDKKMAIDVAVVA